MSGVPTSEVALIPIKTHMPAGIAIISGSLCPKRILNRAAEAYEEEVISVQRDACSRERLILLRWSISSPRQYPVTPWLVTRPLPVRRNMVPNHDHSRYASGISNKTSTTAAIIAIIPRVCQIFHLGAIDCGVAAMGSVSAIIHLF